MKLVVVAAFIAVCGAAKLDRKYLPPSSAETAGGNPGSLQTPLTRSSEQGPDAPKPVGSYTNNFEGVVVDAASPGTRASAGEELSALGGPRPSYGSTDSKVGDAAFRGSPGFHNTPLGANQFDNHAFSSGQAGQFPNHVQGFENKSERPQAAKDRSSNIIAFSNDVSSDNYSYGFETDNGIAVGENGVAVNGVQAEGGYSYRGDDGQMYKVTYTADEGGYRPQGAHLPTPPPIPEEILKSLEQNAKDEAAGLVDDGSYDAQKYNTDGDYTHHNSGNIQYNGAQLSQFGKRPESDASSGTFINQNSQAFGKPGSNVESQSQTTHTTFNGHSDEGNLRPGHGQLNVHNTHSKFNDQQANRNPGSASFGIGEQQNSHSTFNGQSGTGNKNRFEYDSSHSGHSNSQNVHPSQSGHHDISSLNNIGQNSGSQFSSPAGQQDSSGSHSQFGSQFNSHQMLASPQSGSRITSSGAQISKQELNSQFGNKPINAMFGQNTGSPTFNSQASQSQFGSQTFKPQGSEAFDGASLQQQRPSPNSNGNRGQSQISQTGFSQSVSKPSPSDFNNLLSPSKSQFSNIGLSSANNLNIKRPLTPSRLQNKNENLPQLGSIGLTQQDKPKPASGFNSNFDSMRASAANTKFDQITGNNEPNVGAVNGQKTGFSSASASASFGQPQHALPLNHIKDQQESRFPSQTSAQFSFNSQNAESFSSQSNSSLVTKPTSIPNTELTTPLEPNETRLSSQGPQISSQTKPSFSTFGLSPMNNQPQTQFGFQGNTARGQQFSSHTGLSATRPQSTYSQVNAVPTQFPFPSVGIQSENSKTQFSQNSFGQNQHDLNQGAVDSYHYNQPSRPFNSPPVRFQTTRFPSTPSYQSNRLTSQQNTHFLDEQSASQGSLPPSVAPTTDTQFFQTQGPTSSNYFNGVTQANISSFPSIFPTPISMTQNGQFGSNIMKEQNFRKDNYNSKGQSPGSQSNNQNFPQTPGQPSPTIQKPSPSHTQAQFGQNENAPESSDGSSQLQTTINQQYEGTLYEYNKPMQTLPAPSQTDSSSSQTIQAGVISESKPTFGKLQGNQIPSQQNAKPQIGSQDQTFGHNPSSSHTHLTHSNLDSNVGSQAHKPYASAPSTVIQFGHQPQTSQGVQGSELQQATQLQFGAQSGKPFALSAQMGETPPTGAGFTSSQQINKPQQTGTFMNVPFRNEVVSHGIVTAFGSKPQLGSQTSKTQFSHQSFGSPQTSQDGYGSLYQYSQSESGENAASSKGSGYFYPQNPKPHFGNHDNRNQFGQSSEPVGLSQSNQNAQVATSLNQQSQFSAAAKPQFASQLQAQFNQNTQTGQKADITSTQTLGKPNGQSFASSQAIASGQATASAHASSLPLSQKVPLSNFGQNQPDNHDQSGQGTQQENQNQNLSIGGALQPNKILSKPFGGQNQPNGANNRPFGVDGQGSEVPSKPLFSSPCCHASKSENTEKVNRGFNRFQGSQSFNAQNFAGKGEQFGEARQPPRFDEQTGYHY